MADTCVIEVHLYGGDGKALSPVKDVLIRTRAQAQSNFRSDFFDTNPVGIRVPFPDNFNNYTVLASLKDYEDAGYLPLPVLKDQTHRVHLMMLPRNAGFQFGKADWGLLPAANPSLFAFLSSDPDAQRKYSELKEDSKSLGCLLNITAAIASLPVERNLLTRFKGIDLQRIANQSDGVRPDRFFAWVDPQLLQDILPHVGKQGKRLFEKASGSLHPGATSSFKEVRFDEANLQFTFHENDRKTVNGADCIKVEMDLDFYKDKGAHFILEVIPNHASRKLRIGSGLTDPRAAYAMRWMAGKNVGEDFHPIYEIG